MKKNSICTCGSGVKYKLCCGCSKTSDLAMRRIIDPFDEEDWDELDNPMPDDDYHDIRYEIGRLFSHLF